jgi:hypothetical protein
MEYTNLRLFWETTQIQNSLFVSVVNWVSVRTTDWKNFSLTRPYVEFVVSYSNEQECSCKLTVQISFRFSIRSSSNVKGETAK